MLHSRRRAPGLVSSIVSTAVVATSAMFGGACGGGSDAASSPVDQTDGGAKLTSGIVRSTEAGPVRGLPLDGGLVAFEGVPYAAPPTGDLRFRAPTAVEPWGDTRDATAFGPSCVQVDADGKLAGSEDCLTLNVWTTSVAPSSPLPVLVFVPGGNNQIGCSCEATYDGAWLAAHGPAVVVTLNYRLGAFGFLADPSLEETNFGLRDQIAALGWVQRNIAAFGGDPSRVMLFGHSAGSLDTAAVLSSPLATGLFSRVLMESGASVTVAPTVVTATYQAAEKKLGCTSGSREERAACLRGAPVDAVARVPGAVLAAADPEGAEYNPVVDGVVLPAAPLAAARAGRTAAVPIVLGTTKDEYGQLVDLEFRPMPSDEAGYLATLDSIGPSIASELASLYPLATYGAPRAALAAILGDAQMTCPTERFARALARPDRPPVRRYLYAHVFDGDLSRYGAAHGFEVGLVFHTFTPGPASPSDADRALADLLGDAWTKLAATGDPGPAWPVLGAGSEDPYVVLDAPTFTTATGWRTKECAFWDRVGG